VAPTNTIKPLRGIARQTDSATVLALFPSVAASFAPIDRRAECGAATEQHEPSRLDIFHNYICITAIGAAGIGWRGEATARPVVGGSGTRLTARMTMVGDGDASLCLPETGGS